MASLFSVEGVIIWLLWCAGAGLFGYFILAPIVNWLWNRKYPNGEE